jgi:aryl-alcohol dehydrogenase-like predicted oxidoreductase
LSSPGTDIFPIPGTTKLARLEENIAAAAVSLSAEEVAALSAAVPVAAVQGDRYNAHAMQMCHNNQPK